MKKRKNNMELSDEQQLLYELYLEYLEKRAEEEKSEKQVLLEKFKLHTQGKEIVLENSK